MRIDPALYPSPAQLGLLSGFSCGEAVWMVSMQRYRGAAGREAYGRYAEGLQPIVEAHGGRVVAVADLRGLLIGAGELDADTITILEFPDVDTWRTVMALDAVKAISADRVAGLESQLLFLASPRDGI